MVVSRSPLNFATVLLIFRIFCLLGLVVTVLLLPRYWRVAGSTDWPVTQGIIRDAWIKEGYFGRSKSLHFVPRVRFEYTVDGSLLQGSSITLAFREPVFASREAAEEALRAFPVGGKVKVWHDPANPSASALVPGLTDEQRVLLQVVYVLISGLGLACVILFRKHAA